MLELAGAPDTAAWRDALAHAQHADGSFGTLAAGEDAYHQFHATMIAAWALVISE
jgi:hypothetical protein